MLNHVIEFWSKETEDRFGFQILHKDLDRIKNIVKIFKEQKKYKFDQEKLAVFIRKRDVFLRKTYSKPDSMIEM